MSAPSAIRSFHRWVSMAFTLAVIANLVALWAGVQSTLVGVLALVPLVLLLLSGLYLFVLPYTRQRRAPRVE